MTISVHPRKYNALTARLPDVKYGSWWSEGFERAELNADTVLTRVWSPILFKDGKRNHESFEASYWCALDFDSGLYTLEQAINDWCDTQHLIATTKSHQVKKNGHKCDRFRLIVKWSQPIRCSNEYNHNMIRMINEYGADNSCSDTARFFYPCKEWASASDEGYTQDVAPCPPRSPQLTITCKERMETKQAQGNVIPKWCANFLDGEKVPWRDSRNWGAYDVAVELVERGWDSGKIVQKIQAAPFQKDESFNDSEIERRVKSAVRRVERRLRGG